MRYVVHFSCGAASAVAAKLMVSEWSNAFTQRTQSLGLPVRKPWADATLLIVNAFIEEEHADNRRFLDDVAAWIGGKETPWPIKVLRNEKYNASTREVWRKKRYMKGRNGAPCAQELKRKMLATIAQPGDIACIGFTVEEEDRATQLQEMFPSEQFRFPLIEEGLSKADCLAIVERAGIRLTEMYLLGYENSNCIGCVKGGEGYWDKIRRDFPNRFNELVQIQESIGPGAYLFRDRKTGVRFGLKDLPVGAGRYQDEPEISCSFFCAMAEEKITQQEVALWRVRKEMEPIEHIMQFFAYSHLPEHLQAVSAPFGQLAEKIVETLPRNPERTVALRKLLEAKDAAVRALVAK